MDAFDLGFTAQRQGAPFDTCPFETGEERMAWQDGWTEAEIESCDTRPLYEDQWDI